MKRRRRAARRTPRRAERMARLRIRARVVQRDLKDYIGRQLRALYDEVANQPVPDRFKELLDRLDQKMRDE